MELLKVDIVASRRFTLGLGYLALCPILFLLLIIGSRLVKDQQLLRPAFYLLLDNLHLVRPELGSFSRTPRELIRIPAPND